MEYRPPGGFMNFFQDLNGATSFPFPSSSSNTPHPAQQMLRFPFPYPPQFMVPPPAPNSARSSPLASDSRCSSPANISQHRVTVQVDEESRQRMYYTDEEDIRLWCSPPWAPSSSSSTRASSGSRGSARRPHPTTPSSRRRRQPRPRCRRTASAPSRRVSPAASTRAPSALAPTSSPSTGMSEASSDENDDGIIDPTEMFTMEDFIAQQNALNNIVTQLATNIQASMAAPCPRRQPSVRRYIERNREVYNQLLIQDYFSENPRYPMNKFRERYRMRRPLFLRIVEALGQWSPFFTQRRDALNREGLSPLQKCTAAMRMLAYAIPADQADEYIKIGESTTLLCLDQFAEGVIAKFGAQYLRRPNTEDIQRLLDTNEARGFPGMLGSLDCMHWQWKNCPVGWKGQYTRGDYKVSTIILEAVASHDLWIWHAFFGVAGANNDINVLNQSPLFTERLQGNDPQVEYYVNGRQYNIGYYLADGIYPEWAALVKTIREPQTEKHKLFAQKQEGARKDVERAFGVLKARFKIIAQPSRLWDQSDIGQIMRACVILHNMIVEDEKEMVEDFVDLNETPGSSTATAPTVHLGSIPEFTQVVQRDAEIRDQTMHNQLKRDLVEHIWERFSHNINN